MVNTPEAHQLDPILRDKRDLMRARLRLIQRRTCVVNSVFLIMEKFNVTNPDDLPGLYQFQYQQLNRQEKFLISWSDPFLLLRPCASFPSILAREIFKVVFP